MSDIWKKTMAITFLACALAVLFPPSGYWNDGYEGFHRFEFIFSGSRDVLWKHLGAVILIIIFVGLAIGFFLSSRKS